MNITLPVAAADNSLRDTLPGTGSSARRGNPFDDLRMAERRLNAAVRRFGALTYGNALTARRMLRLVQSARRARSNMAAIVGPNWHGPMIDYVCESSAKAVPAYSFTEVEFLVRADGSARVAA